MNGSAAAEPYWRRRAWWLQTGRSGAVLFVGTGFAFLTTVMAGRALGPTNFGVLALATATVAWLATFLDFSLEEAVVHHGARLLTEGKPGDVRALLRTSLKLDAVVGLAVFAIVMAVAEPLASFVSDGALAPMIVRLAAVEILAATVNGTTGAALLLGGRAELRAWAMAGTALLRLVGVLVAVRVSSGGVEAVLWGYIAGSALGAAGQLLLARHAARAWGGPRVERRPVGVRALATFGMHSSVTTTILAARLAVVAIVVGRTSGATDVGLLSVAMLPVTLAGVVTAPLRIMTFPEQATLAAEGRLDVLWQGLRAYTGVALVVGAAAAAIGYVLLPWLVPWLYSDAFRAAVEPARILLPAALVTLAIAWAKALPAAVGRPQVRTWVSLGELAVTAVAVLVLADRGASGAALAVTIGTCVAGIAWYLTARRMLAAAGPPLAAEATVGDERS